MIKGIDVEVSSPTYGTKDRFGNSTATYGKSVTVHNVLVAPGAAQSLEVARPEGVKVALTLHFPKSHTTSLEGCKITLPAPWTGTYRVIGNPQPFIDANIPGDWHMPVEVEGIHG